MFGRQTNSNWIYYLLEWQLHCISTLMVAMFNVHVIWTRILNAVRAWTKLVRQCMALRQWFYWSCCCVSCNRNHRILNTIYRIAFGHRIAVERCHMTHIGFLYMWFVFVNRSENSFSRLSDDWTRHQSCWAEFYVQLKMHYWKVNICKQTLCMRGSAEWDFIASLNIEQYLF